MSLKRGNNCIKTEGASNSSSRSAASIYCMYNCGFAHHEINECKKHEAICSNNPLRDIFCTKCKTKYGGQIAYDQHVVLVHCEATVVEQRIGHGCPPKSKK